MYKHFCFNKRLCGQYNICIIINCQLAANYTTSNHLKKCVVTISNSYLVIRKTTLHNTNSITVDCSA